MRRHDINLTTVVLRSFLIVQLSPIVLSCIYLLNGWMPMPVYNRTAKADIVISAHVIKTYKEAKFRTDAQTYTATIKLFDIYKGKTLLRNIPSNKDQPNIYNVTNFGDRKMCYADVMDDKNYVLFLTTYKQRLSAKYDDIFGAVTKFTEKNVQEVLSQIGSDLENWSGWSSCSRSCNGGYQMRKRLCQTSKGKCDIASVDKRACNNFVCKETHDILSYLGVYKLPLGVYHVHMRPGAFNVTQSAKLFSIFSDIYPDYLPQNFAILMSLKFIHDYSGYFFTLSDLMGKQKLAVKFSIKDVTCTLTLEYYDDEDLPVKKAAEFEFEITDTWHQFAVAVTENTVELHVDCETVLVKELYRSDYSRISSNLMMSLGPYFARYGPTFQGEIEQLLITDDPSAAAHQCSTDFDDIERAIKDEGNNEIDEDIFGAKTTTIKVHRKTTTDKPKDLTTIEEKDEPAEWTEWSQCSRSCGRGVQTRTLYCGNDIISHCVYSGYNSEETRWCFIRSCSVTCKPGCDNGGTCSRGGNCLCPQGFAGPTCGIATCFPNCINGGRCSAPGVCTCPTGYTGRSCETAICSPRCSNGGQCIQPGYCTCPYGYMPPACEPICVLPCRNGGKCIRHDKCKCLKGYTGRDCSIPVCRRGCFNGGRCVAPNMCSCPRGYGGSKCHKPICYPPCQNNGRCLYPGICQCKRRYSGPLCENFVCKKPCQNGGICAENNTCACLDGYRGRWCHKQKRKTKCQTHCFNGGRCRNKRCRCRPGFKGSRCEKRECNYKTYLKPYTQTYRKLHRQEVATKCGPWKWKTCVESRVMYVISTRTFYRTAYKCL